MARKDVRLNTFLQRLVYLAVLQPGCLLFSLVDEQRAEGTVLNTTAPLHKKEHHTWLYGEQETQQSRTGREAPAGRAARAAACARTTARARAARPPPRRAASAARASCVAAPPAPGPPPARGWTHGVRWFQEIYRVFLGFWGDFEVCTVHHPATGCLTTSPTLECDLPACVPLPPWATPST